jgi:hypothetical protein
VGLKLSGLQMNTTEEFLAVNRADVHLSESLICIYASVARQTRPGKIAGFSRFRRRFAGSVG